MNFNLKDNLVETAAILHTNQLRVFESNPDTTKNSLILHYLVVLDFGVLKGVLMTQCIMGN